MSTPVYRCCSPTVHSNAGCNSPWSERTCNSRCKLLYAAHSINTSTYSQPPSRSNLPSLPFHLFTPTPQTTQLNKKKESRSAAALKRHQESRTQPQQQPIAHSQVIPPLPFHMHSLTCDCSSCVAFRTVSYNRLLVNST
jgi:hypothetical protein